MAAPIAVYGASGYTGRLIAAEAARRGVEVVLCGRSEERLRGAAREAGLEAATVRAAPVDDDAALDAAIGDCAAVIACAGPFTRVGEPVVRAAVRTGTHYIDTTGEQGFMRKILDAYDEPARAAGVAIVNAAGFDYLPGDLVCRLAAAGHEPLSELVVAYALADFGASRGTMRSTFDVLGGGDVAWVDGAWRPAGPGPLRASFQFPEPIGRTPVIKYPSGEPITVPRHVRTRRVTSLLSFAELGRVPGLATVAALGMAVTPLIARTPVRGLVEAGIGVLPEGPDEHARRRSRFEIVAVARGEDGSTGRATVRGRDVYGLTAAAMIEGATRMAQPGYDKSGVLPPALAFDAASFLDALAEGDFELSYDVG